MLTLGCDIGSLFVKAAVMDGDDLLGGKIARVTGNLADEINDFLQAALREAGVGSRKVDRLVATGRGADLLPRADFMEDDVTCVAAAVGFHLPQVRLALDIGGQSITALLLSAEGEVADFMRNDKCASGSGRFLEVMSEKLELEIADLDRVVAAAAKPVTISNQCGVFAESEVITHVNSGERPEDVMAGVCGSVAKMVLAQGRRFGEADHYTLTGGVASFVAVNRIIQEKLAGTYQPFPHDPQLAAAIGAALLGDAE